jgi:hypothetical protein
MAGHFSEGPRDAVTIANNYNDDSGMPRRFTVESGEVIVSDSQCGCADFQRSNRGSAAQSLLSNTTR